MDVPDSFYYFFSAVPQVLGGILALFGVFIVFKLQAIKTHLLGISQTILDQSEITYLYYNRQQNTSFSKKLRKAIDTNDISMLKDLVNSIETEVHRVRKATETNDRKVLKVSLELKDIEHFGPLSRSFQIVFASQESLINDTFMFSIFTGATIIFCLIILPLDAYILKVPCLLGILFFLVIICVAYSFYGLVSILKRSLQYKN